MDSRFDLELHVFICGFGFPSKFNDRKATCYEAATNTTTKGHVLRERDECYDEAYSVTAERGEIQQISKCYDVNRALPMNPYRGHLPRMQPYEKPRDTNPCYFRADIRETCI